MVCANTVAAQPEGPQAWLLNNQSRLHLRHGPIDLIIDAVGNTAEVEKAYKQAAYAFKHVLNSLTGQLPLLRSRYCGKNDQSFKGPVANLMMRAVMPYRKFNLTPMISVAGAVADHILSCMCAGRQLQRVQVNNGGDIAIYLSEENTVKIGICPHPGVASYTDTITLDSSSGVGGIATSGWRGRSYSFGIADAVTVLAKTAAQADVASTLIANAVDLPISTAGIKRVPASELEPDSDLGGRSVTVEVTELSLLQKTTAIQAGLRQAKSFLASGGITSCYINVQGLTRAVGSSASLKLHS